MAEVVEFPVIELDDRAACVVDTLMELLEKARAGEIRSLFAITYTSDGELARSVWSAKRVDMTHALGMLSAIQHDMLTHRPVD
jgi:hypothetical protein